MSGSDGPYTPSGPSLSGHCGRGAARLRIVQSGPKSGLPGTDPAWRSPFRLLCGMRHCQRYGRWNQATRMRPSRGDAGPHRSDCPSSHVKRSLCVSIHARFRWSILRCCIPGLLISRLYARLSSQCHCRLRRPACRTLRVFGSKRPSLRYKDQRRGLPVAGH